MRFRAIAGLLGCAIAWHLGIQDLRADDVNVAGQVVSKAASRPLLAGRPVGLYAAKDKGQRLDVDKTSPSAIYSLAARGISGSVVSLYVLYDDTDFDAEPVEVHPEPPKGGLRRAKAKDLVLLDAKTLLSGTSITSKGKGVPVLAASFFSDLEVRKWAGVVNAEDIAERVAGFVARVGGTTEKVEDQISRIALIWGPESTEAVAKTFGILHLHAKADVAMTALKSPRVGQLLKEHFSTEGAGDSWLKRFNVRVPLSPSTVKAFTGTITKPNGRLPEDIEFMREVLGIQQDPVLSAGQKQEIFSAVIHGAGLWETVKPDASSLADYFPRASAEEKRALIHALRKATKN
jgi:hypothetical protein